MGGFCLLVELHHGAAELHQPVLMLKKIEVLDIQAGIRLLLPTDVNSVHAEAQCCTD